MRAGRLGFGRFELDDGGPLMRALLSVSTLLLLAGCVLPRPVSRPVELISPVSAERSVLAVTGLTHLWAPRVVAVPEAPPHFVPRPAEESIPVPEEPAAPSSTEAAPALAPVEPQSVHVTEHYRILGRVGSRILLQSIQDGTTLPVVDGALIDGCRLTYPGFICPAPAPGELPLTEAP